MNGNGTLTAALRVSVTSDLKQRLKALARLQRRSLASTVRVLLEESLELEDTLRPPNPQRDEYEAVLTTTQAARLLRRGYELQVLEPIPTQLTLL